MVKKLNLVNSSSSENCDSKLMERNYLDLSANEISSQATSLYTTFIIVSLFLVLVSELVIVLVRFNPLLY